MKALLLWTMAISMLVSGFACGSVSSRLSRVGFFDAVLFSEAKRGARDAIFGVLSHCIFLVAFLTFFYLSLHGDI
jgi:hypothetical protein